MDRLWEIATPGTWALLTLASVSLMAAFVLLSHTLVRSKAYGDDWGGWTARGRLERTVRAGLACLLAGGALWAVTLHAPAWVVAALATGAAVLAGVQLYAVIRAGGGSGPAES